MSTSSLPERRWKRGLEDEGDQLGKLEYEATSAAQKKSLLQLFGIDADSFFQGKTVLEVGCSPLALIHGIPEPCFKVGIDPLTSSRRFRDFYRGGTLVHHVTGMAEHLPFKDDRYGIVICINTLDHVSDPPLALREMLRVLGKGGSALLVVHTFSLPRVSVSLLSHLDQHSHHFRSDDVFSLVSQSGAAVQYARSQRISLNQVVSLLRKGLTKSALKLLCAILLRIRDSAYLLTKAA